MYHGHTFTSKIPFREVVSTLGKYAFQASDFPVILSLENHCSMEQQEVLAQQLKDILGEQLLTATTDGRVPTQLPSPEELKHKILLKGKKIGRLEDTLDGPGDEAPDVSDDDNGAEAEEERRRMKKDRESLAQALSDCVVYCKNVSFRGFQEARNHSRPSEISSLSEAKARKLIRDAGNEFVRHNTWQLTRIYPSGMRTDSSNYSPQEMWNAGCQIVALNFQTAGMEMDLCDGLFSQNGHCGYVLKPAFMRDEGTLFNPSDPSTWQGPGPVTLTIQVISGQQLPKVANSKDGAIIDPLVRVEIHGVPADQAHQETKYIENNGTRPFSSSSTCPSWPLSALWWRIMTRPPGTISWDSSPWPLPTSNLATATSISSPRMAPASRPLRSLSTSASPSRLAPSKTEPTVPAGPG